MNKKQKAIIIDVDGEPKLNRLLEEEWTVVSVNPSHPSGEGKGTAGRWLVILEKEVL